MINSYCLFVFLNEFAKITQAESEELQRKLNRERHERMMEMKEKNR